MTHTQQEQGQVPTKIKYSKSSSFYLKIKQNYFDNNTSLLSDAATANKLYSSQPIRTTCKICREKISNEIDLYSHGIGYIFCANCSHLNGQFEETQEFVEQLYITNSGNQYSKGYIDKDFNQRTMDIYYPKLEFLIQNLPNKNFELLDVGSGAGYFVNAALMKKIRARGLDVNKTMVDFGNTQIFHNHKQSPLTLASEDSFFQSIVEADVDVISALGVIEHLRDPHMFFEAFRKSKAQYLFYIVPMVSFSIILESIFSKVYPRVLSGGHTHLFTDESVLKMNQQMGSKSIAEWRFGADAFDLYRCLSISLKSTKLNQYFDMKMLNSIDEFQHIIDKKHFCSELHGLIKKI